MVVGLASKWVEWVEGVREAFSLPPSPSLLTPFFYVSCLFDPKLRREILF